MPQTTKAPCAKCNNVVNHKVLSAQARSYTPEDTPGMTIDWANAEWEILECAGCSDICFRETWWTSEDHDEEGQPAGKVTYYPPRGEGKRTEKSLPSVPWMIRRAYAEVIRAFNSDSDLLCGAGLRMLVEAICAELKVTGGLVPKRDKTGKQEVNKGVLVFKRSNNLDGKINGLAEGSHLSKRHAEMLHGHRFMGNDVVHALNAPNRGELMAAIEIIEHTLENLFELDEHARLLRRERTDKPGFVRAGRPLASVAAPAAQFPATVAGSGTTV